MVEHRETMGQQREASSQDDGRGPIRSAAHPLLKRMGAILAGKERQACVLEGDRLVDDARAGRATIEVVLVAADRESRALELERGGLRVVRVDPELLARKSALRSSPGIAALAAAPRTAGLDELALAPDALLLVIAGVSDPGNLGALARSAEAAGARGLVLLPGTAHPFGDKALRGSMGSLLRLSVAFCESAAEAAAGPRTARIPIGGRGDSRRRLAGARELVGARGPVDRVRDGPGAARDGALRAPHDPHGGRRGVAQHHGGGGPAPVCGRPRGIDRRNRRRRAAGRGGRPQPTGAAMSELFGDDPREVATDASAALGPLADRMRPRHLEEYVGQEKLLGPGRFLERAAGGLLSQSLILWGPPGSGKTTLARLLAAQSRMRFVPFSAVLSGIKEVREVMHEAAAERKRSGVRTLLFVDEIHRFNKAQQDAFLPFVEAGDIVLIGATTENPSFELNGALLSRARVLILQPLTTEELVDLLERALADPRGLRGRLRVDRATFTKLAHAADGDARRALNLLETASSLLADGAELDRRRVGASAAT
jgi:hypothetical protein